jgi:hypothetical protein
MVKTTHNTSSQDASKLPETWTEEYRALCEARSWMERFQQIKSSKGRSAAVLWWRETIKDIEKIRGKRAADKLRKNMNDFHGSIPR